MEFETIEGLITINATLLLQVVHFLILLLILNRIMFRPLLKIIQERDSYLEEKKLGIEKVEREVEQLREKFLLIERDARIEAAKESAEYREAGLSEAEKLIAESRKEVSLIKSRTDDIVREKIAEAKADLEDKALTIAEEMIEKIIGRRVVA